MLGRAPYANPYLLNELDQAIYKTQPVNRFEVMYEYFDYACQEHTAVTHIKHLAKHLLGLFTGLNGARAFRRHLSTNMFDDRATPNVILEAGKLVSQDIKDTFK